MSTQAAAIAARPRVTRRMVKPGTVLFVASLGVFMEFVDSTIVNIAFPAIHHDFPATALTTLSWVFNAYSIVFAAFLVVSGRIADLLGRKRMFQFGILLFTLASALCATAPSVNFLIAARALQALGGAIVVPASLALVINAFPPEKRAGALTTYGASAALAAALGPPIGGLLIKALSWRLCFLVNVPIGFGVLLLAARILVESRSPGRRTLPDLPGALVLAVSLVLLTLGIVRGPDWGWASPAVIACFAVSIALGVLFFRRSSWHRSPVIDFELLRARRFSFANAAIGLAGIGFYAYLLCHALFLILVWRYSAFRAGLSFIPAALLAAVMAAGAGRLSERRGFRAIIVPGALIWALSLFWYRTQVGVHPQWLSQWLPGALLTGVGAGLTLPQVGAAAIAAAPGTRYATAAALNTTARQLGGALGIALVIVIIGNPSADSLRNGWVFSGSCFVLVALLAFGLGSVGRVEPGKAVELEAEEVPRAPAPEPQPFALIPGARRSADEADTSTVGFLRSVALLSDVSDELRGRIAATARTVRLGAGEWLFRRQDPVDGLYVVRAGRLEVLLDDDAPPVRELGRGEVLGELAILAEAGRSASIRARRDSELLLVPIAEFSALLAEEAELPLALSRRLAGQLQHSRRLDSSHPGGALPRTIAIVRAPGAGEQTLAGDLLGALASHGSLAQITSADAGPADRVQVLDRAERGSDRVALICTPSEDDPGWSEFCTRQADHVVAVGLLSPDQRPRGPHDVLLTERAGFERYEPPPRVVVGAAGAAALARSISGRAVGLVLSGGGARALAHVGVLAELEALGIEIDRVGGTGTGALIAAMFAAGMDAAEIDARCYDELVRRNTFSDYRPTRTALIRGRRVSQMLVRLFGEQRFEDLERPCFCVSADLVAGERIVHRTGSVRDGLLAALTIPGLMAPVASDGRLLVDAGAIDNLPVGVMAESPEGPIIAVDVSEREGGPALIEPAGRPRRHGAPAAAALPGLREAVARTAILGSLDAAAAARALAQLTIAPDAGGVGMLEFHQLDVLRDAGRRATRAALAGRSLAGAG